jgi:hypothetical protein
VAANEVDMTDCRLWNEPVLIVIGTTKHPVRSTGEAAWLLADRWPVLTGKAFTRALKACAAAIDGKRSTAFARLALIAAARDANLVVEA